MRQFIFFALLAGAFGFFGWTCYRLVRFVLLGRPENRLDRIPERLWSVVVYYFGQKKVAEEKGAKGSSHHLWIFWGFLVITIGTVEMLVQGLAPSFSLAFIGQAGYAWLKGTIEAFNLIVLVMVLWAFFRRIVLKPRNIPMSLDAGVILGLIAGLMITHFLFHGLRFVAGEEAPGWAFLSSRVAGWFAGTSPSAAHVVSEASWWTHVVILLAFMNYLPFSKHIHIIFALPNIFFRNLGAKGVMPKLDLEDETQWGVAKAEQFTWKALLDGYACTECARCTNYCPANTTGKPLDPMRLIHDVHHDLRERGSLLLDLAGGKNGDRQKQLDALPALTGGRPHTDDESLWACTTCGACEQVCPVFIEHPMKILQMRTFLTLNEPQRVPTELQRTFTNLERNGNPWGIGKDKRMDWAEGQGVPTIDEKPAPEVLLWVGCAGAFDDRVKKQTIAMVKILKIAKVDYAVLGNKERCTGDPARRSGNELLYQQLAQENVATLNAHNVKTVLTSCPHCFHTLKNEYPQLGGNYEVIHHTQFLARLLADKKISPLNSVVRNLTYHDSCYLGRWNGEYDAPRAVLAAIPTPGGLVELGRKREKSFCCGAGGARMWMEEKTGERVNRNRVKEALETGVEAIATACPFCTIMLRDGVADEGAAERVKVMDVAELVAASLADVLVAPAPITEPPEQEGLPSEEFGTKPEPRPERGWQP
ncbi:MAG: (Fe-S)-binding protein [Myxococcota bacterium]